MKNSQNDHKEPNKTNLINQNNNKEKNEFGIDLDLEQLIINEIKSNKGKSKFRICKERPAFIPMTEREIQLMVDTSDESRESLKAKGKLVHRLYQIQAIRDINNPFKFIKRGEYGGFINSAANLNWSDESWIEPDVMLLQSAYISNNALLSSNIIISGCLSISSELHLNNPLERIVMDHKGIYFANSNVYTPHKQIFNNEEIQNAYNQHWIRNEVARQIIPFNIIR